MRFPLISRLNLANKLALIFTSAILAVLLILGSYFDAFLKESYLESGKKRIEHGLQRLAYNLDNIEYALRDGIEFAKTDRSLVASVELINKYEDPANYNVYLIDEEKKSIANVLLNRVKLSFNDDIAIYDEDEKLIAYVIKEDSGYRLNYISYHDGNQVLFSRSEDDAEYHTGRIDDHALITIEHIPYYEQPELKKSILLTRHVLGDELIIKSHLSIFEPGSERVIAHLEMSRKLNERYFALLSTDLDIGIRHVPAGGGFVEKTSELSVSSRDLFIEQDDSEYMAVAAIDTRDGPTHFVATLDKGILQSILDENRKRFLLLLLLVAGVVLLIVRVIMNRSLTEPLDDLMAQIHKIEKQDYVLSNPVRTGDELEAISRNVYGLAEAVKERENSLRLSQKELEYLSNHDPLTELPNRRLFTDRLQHALDLAERNGDKLALLFLDLDQFKLVNDTLGHDVGDELLVAVSRRLQGHIRETDTLARIGGDEFTILVENIQDERELETFLLKVMNLFHEPFPCSQHEVRSSVSIGVALYPKDGHDIVTLTKHADLAMYKAKDMGRSNYHFFSDELAHTLREKTELTRALEDAIDDGIQFELHYQPKISLSTGKIVSVEALIRWNSPKYGYVFPNSFIPLAEETGLIIPIGSWVLEQAARDFAAMRNAGMLLEHVAVNLSSIQLQHGDMVENLKRVLDAGLIEPEQLELEITESYIATDAQEAVTTLNTIRSMGVNIAIDDFGTGYSSMSYLQQLPVSRIKIDKSFVDRLPVNAESVAITRAIIGLAKSFGLQVTAEGVETADQMSFLRGEACDEIQGFYIAKPLRMSDFIEFTRNVTLQNFAY